MRLVAIDPGYSFSKPGGIALHHNGEWFVRAMPLMEVPGAAKAFRHIRQCDLYTLTSILRDNDPDLVVIEGQGARPNQNVASMFKAGIHFGTLIGVCAALDLAYELVQPATWKVAMGLKGMDKEECRQHASKLLPQCAKFWPRRMDHGCAEAALIALWRIARAQSPAAPVSPSPGYRFGRKGTGLGRAGHPPDTGSG